jgi:tetratricopeptide (TPR) repeat protein
LSLDQWSVRVARRGEDWVRGVGVYLGQGLVLTCAHVVGDALGLGPEDVGVPRAPVDVDFPGIAPGEWGPATVMADGWWPAGPDRRGDAAVLRLSGPVPDGASPAPLTADCRPGDPVVAYGYPEGYDDGVYAQARVAGRTLTTGWFQLEDERRAGETIQRGFSGAAAERADGGGVVGIIAWAAKRSSGSRTAWLLPVPLIARQLAPVREALHLDDPQLDHAGTRCPLPADLPDFTGRDDEIERIRRRIEAAGHGPVIHALAGVGGVGKTRLAVHLAHRLAADYPDGQYFLDLRTHTPGRDAAPLTAREVLTRLLGATLGRLPNTGDPERLARMWRDVLHRQRLLVVLDDVASYEQIEPLLPESSRSLMLVTGRRILAELGGRRGAVRSLKTLDEEASIRLFTAVVGEERAAAEPDEAGRIVRLCGYLPLAIRIKASFADVRQGQWSLAEVREELEEARQRLDKLRLGTGVSVRSAFETSYRHLSSPARELFRRLALHPPGTVGHHAAASLMDDPTRAEAAVEELLAESLCEDAGRYRLHLHDLLREFAGERLADEEPGHERHRAHAARLLDYYLALALTGARLLVPARPVDDRPGTPPAWTPRLPSRAAALTWFQAEQRNLVGCSAVAAVHGLTDHLWRIPRAMGPYLGLAAAVEDATAVYTPGLAAAVRSGDERAAADLRALVGDIHRITGPQRDALAAYREAAAHYTGAGDRIAAADMLVRGSAVQRENDPRRAVESCERALAEYTAVGDDFGAAEAQYMLGMVRRTQGDYPAAEAHLGEALARYERVDHPVGQARCLGLIGVIRRLDQDYEQSIATLRLAERLYRAAGDTRGLAHTVNNLASALGLAGRTDEAVALHGEALDLFRRSRAAGYPDALMVAGDLHSRRGDHGAAEKVLREALELYRTVGARLGGARAHLLLSVALLGQGHPSAALSEAHESLRLYRELGNEPGQAAARRAVADCGARGERAAGVPSQHGGELPQGADG